MAKEVFIPKLGQTMEEATLVRWLVEEGAAVEEGQPILDVDTDKATFTVEAPAKGFLHRGPHQAGEVVPVLTVVATVGAAGDTFARGTKAAPAGPPASGPLSPSKSDVPSPGHLPNQVFPPQRVGEPSSPGQGESRAEEEWPPVASPSRVFASPRARSLAAARGVDLSRVKPTGYAGERVAERDVVAYLKELPKATPLAQKMAAEVGVDWTTLAGTGIGGAITKGDVEMAARPAPRGPAASPAAEEEVLARVPLKGVRAIIAERMAGSVHTTARVTLFMEADATELVNMRERLRGRVEKDWGFAPGYNDFLAKMVAAALRQFPYMNARLTPEAIEHMAHINLGMAVDTERGLMVPVIRDADTKSLRQFGSEFRALADRARNGKAMPDDLAGGTFTITNLGMYDVLAFTPVINPPEAAILGVGTISPEPQVRGGEIVIRQMMMLSLVFDHRLVDGGPAARFLQFCKSLIEEPYLWVAQ